MLSLGQRVLNQVSRIVVLPTADDGHDFDLGFQGQLVFGNIAPPELILSLPYIATVLGVWISSRLRGGAAALSELREY